MRRSALALVPLLALSFGACNALKREGLKVHPFNQDPPQSPAVIQLSDPQIYSRETLINDRRREAEYLKTLLDESVNSVFEPEIRRSLRMLTSTAVSLSAAFDPLAGTTAERGDELAAVQHRTELARARAELVEAERTLQALLSGEASEPRQATAASESEEDGGEGDGGEDSGQGGEESSGGGGSGGTTSSRPNTELLSSIQSSVERLRGILDALPATAEVRAAAVDASPRDLFRDRQAYRSELRAAFSEVELDDSHDRGQNSLYRLQFRATVFPGQHPDKFGVARLTLEPPKLTKDDIAELYKTWLAHVTSRLNQTESGRFVSDPSYLLLGTGVSSMFDIARIPIYNPPNGDPTYVRIALPPGGLRILRPYLEGITEPDDLHKNIQEFSRQISRFESLHVRQRFRLEYNEAGRFCTPSENSEWADLFYISDDLYWVQDSLSSSLRGIVPSELLSLEYREGLEKLMTYTADLTNVVSRAIEIWVDVDPRCFHRGSDFGQIPEHFVKAIIKSQDGETFQPDGDPLVYATAPVELAQRISTTASASRTFEMALALSASLATQGIGAEAGLGRLRASQRDLEALERSPLVVGFADRENTGQESQFGWIFGPRAEVNGRKLGELQWRQPLVNHVVTADLSVPGWWPWVTLHQDNAWIANWWDYGEVLRDHRESKCADDSSRTYHEECFRVHLPLNRADLDGLTELLATKTTGGSLPFTKITAVKPDHLAVCNEEVTFVVYGANIWRGTEAFLNGMPAADMRLLPDMAGVAITFKGVRNLPRLGADESKALLTVWTRDGAASKEVTLLDGRAAGLRCDGDRAPLLRLAVRTPRLTGFIGQVKLAASSGRLPKRFSHLGVALRPVRFAKPWSRLLPDTPRFDPQGSWLEGPVDFTHAFDGLQDGDLLESVLVEHFAPHEPPVYHSCDGRTVYYESKETANARLVTPQIASLQEPVVIRLPRRFDIGYPGLRSAQVVGSVAGKPQVVVSARQLLWPEATVSEPSLRVLLEAHGKLEPGDVIQLRLTGAPGLPEIAGGPLKVAGR